MTTCAYCSAAIPETGEEGQANSNGLPPGYLAKPSGRGTPEPSSPPTHRFCSEDCRRATAALIRLRHQRAQQKIVTRLMERHG